MGRASNWFITIVNCLSLIISFAAVVGAAWIHLHESSSSPCQRAVQTPLFLAGIVLLVISLLGLVGSSCRISALLWIYLLLVSLMIVGLMCFTILASAVTNMAVGKGFREHRLVDYSHWLQKHVVNARKWDAIKGCMDDAKVCRSLSGDYAVSHLYMQELSSMQSGCCKPPLYCQYTKVNATFWEVPKTGPAVEDSDCKTWSNNQQELCYNCNSCKRGVLANIRQQWKKLVILNVIATIILIIVYSLGCSAHRSSRIDHKYYRYQGY